MSNKNKLNFKKNKKLYTFLVVSVLFAYFFKKFYGFLCAPKV